MKKNVLRRILCGTLCVMLLGSTVIGCGGSKDSGAKTESAPEFRRVYSEEIKTLNYLKTSETTEFGALANMIDSLVDYDKYGVVQPCLATEWKANEDNTVWTFKIRENVKWLTKDKKEYADVVAQDFVDGLKYVLDNKNESETVDIAAGVVKNGSKFYKGEITDFSQVGVKAIDEHTLEYTLEKPTPYFLSILCLFHS